MMYRDLAYDNYTQGLIGDKAVVESWATGVEWMFTTERYRKIGNPTYSYQGGYQGRSIGGSEFNRTYTSIVVDMIDDDNQRARLGANRPQDQVENYTILQIQQGLKGARAWHEWSTNMRRINNPTSNNINELFGNWH